MALIKVGNNVLSTEEAKLLHSGLDAIEQGVLQGTDNQFILDALRLILPKGHTKAETPEDALAALKAAIALVEDL